MTDVALGPNRKAVSFATKIRSGIVEYDDRGFPPVGMRLGSGIGELAPVSWGLEARHALQALAPRHLPGTRYDTSRSLMIRLIEVNSE